MSDKVIGYKLKLLECGNQWVFAGTTPREVAMAVQNEIESSQGPRIEDYDMIILEPYETTYSEIEALPEFEGWL